MRYSYPSSTKYEVMKSQLYVSGSLPGHILLNESRNIVNCAWPKGTSYHVWPFPLVTLNYKNFTTLKSVFWYYCYLRITTNTNKYSPLIGS